MDGMTGARKQRTEGNGGADGGKQLARAVATDTTEGLTPVRKTIPHA
jgi:hypothetical protein